MASIARTVSSTAASVVPTRRTSATYDGEGGEMKAEPLSGEAAKRKTLEIKLEVARLRAEHAPDAKLRAAEAANALRFEKQLASLDRTD